MADTSQEMNQEDDMTERNQSDNGGDSKEWVNQYALPISGLLIIGGAVVSLLMALKKVKEAALWFIPVALFGAGIALAAKPLEERKTRIEATQEEIISLLDQLDPVAKAQVAEYVAEAEFAKS